ncbi:unnamed protein product, partial [Iphiclides podalirius]
MPVLYKDSKYVLKSDAVPSIFTWNVKKNNMDFNGETSETNKSAKDTLTSRKESEPENLDAIKKFIEDQEKEIQEQKCEQEINQRIEDEHEMGTNQNKTEEPLAVAASVMDLILSESEARLLTKKGEKSFEKQCMSSNEKSSMALSVGSKVEAKDFGEFWYPAQILEVDYDEMEVLVHYENCSKKHDEWINVSSPRLRPLSNLSRVSPSASVDNETVNVCASVKEEIRDDEKPTLKFVVGERCLARWRDNRRFMATINKDLGNGSYEIIFDDGFQWKCTTGRLYKLKRSTETGEDPSALDTSSSSTSANPSPIPYGAGPSSALPPPAFHTHLFDPARDYLGTKSERREKKRKLNIKEIFNIGQKKRRKQSSPKDKDAAAPRTVKQRKPRRKIRTQFGPRVKAEIKTEIPDAVASIIGTVAKGIDDLKEDTLSADETPILQMHQKQQETIGNSSQSTIKDEPFCFSGTNESELSDTKNSTDLVLEEETKLENFESVDDRKHEEVIDRIKEAITKLEDGISKAERVDSPIIEIEKQKEDVKDEKDTIVIKEEPVNIEDVKVENVKPPEEQERAGTNEGKMKRTISKMKKSKKLRLLQEKKVKKQVEKVKSELEEMKRQVEEMKKQMLMKTEVLTSPQKPEMPESFLLPGEWCCRWVNGQPVGTVSEIESEVKCEGGSKPLPRRSVQVEDKRLPQGWTKHMVRRSLGNSAGKWDVVLVSPDNRRFHTKTDMRAYLEGEGGAELRRYEAALLDFGVHLKLARRMGWVASAGREEPVTPLPAGLMSTSSPLVKRRKLGLKRATGPKGKGRRLCADGKIRRVHQLSDQKLPGTSDDGFLEAQDGGTACDSPTLEDGCVFVGALKVQIVDNLLRCPAEGCLKNFRNNTLLKMHIKHYHRELRKMLGATPKVLDLAYARTRPTKADMIRKRDTQSKIIKVKIPRPAKRSDESKVDMRELDSELRVDIPLSPSREHEAPRALDSPKLRDALVKKPVKRPKVLLPVRRPDPDIEQTKLSDLADEDQTDREDSQSTVEILDFETAISTHTVTKPVTDGRKGERAKRRAFAPFAKRPPSEDEEWLTMNSDVETRSSFPGSGTPDSKTTDVKASANAAASSESNEDQKEPMYTYTETGERIKIVQMKREEIINCHCGYREEDGLMVQCELCLCWQHALCHNIQKESEVPEKYTCSICLNPRRGRRSRRFVHDQDRLYEGLLPGARPCEPLRRAHELAGNLLRVQDALHALRVKCHVAAKKDHPKLYLWAKDWESTELSIAQEKLNSDYSDLSIIINNIGKENLPLKADEVRDLAEEHEERLPLGPQTLLSGLLSSPGGGPLELPISTSELERLAKSVQEQPASAPAPQPEAAIENGACRERLLRHIQRCQALVDARLDSIEAQVAELESQDPSFEDDETADYFPRTKQTIQMLMRDLDTMEELGVIT